MNQTEQEGPQKEKEEKFPNEEEINFEERVKDLDSAQRLIDYLKERYTFEFRKGNEAYSPKEFFRKKKGAARDFAASSA